MFMFRMGEDGEKEGERARGRERRGMEVRGEDVRGEERREKGRGEERRGGEGRRDNSLLRSLCVTSSGCTAAVVGGHFPTAAWSESAA